RLRLEPVDASLERVGAVLVQQDVDATREGRGVGLGVEAEAKLERPGGEGGRDQQQRREHGGNTRHQWILENQKDVPLDPTRQPFEREEIEPSRRQGRQGRNFDSPASPLLLSRTGPEV